MTTTTNSNNNNGSNNDDFSRQLTMMMTLMTMIAPTKVARSTMAVRMTMDPRMVVMTIALMTLIKNIVTEKL